MSECMCTDIDQKICKWCGETKNIKMFHAHKEMKDGHLNKCNNCIGAYQKEYFSIKENRKHRSDRDKDYSHTEQGIAVRKRAKKKWLTSKKGAKYRERDNARTKKLGRDKVYRMVRSLEKKPCERCGQIEFVHAHHDDYLKPLDVTWLCPVHHKIRHKELMDAD